MPFHRHHRSVTEEGQGLVEYALILVLVAVVVIFILALFGTTLRNTYCRITYGLSPAADLSSACSVPIVTPKLMGRGPGILNIEAEVNDPDGDPANPYAAITQVEFYIDSTAVPPVEIQYFYRYCLGDNTGTNPCWDYDLGGLSPGQHTVIIWAYDADGNVGKAQYKFTI